MLYFIILNFEIMNNWKEITLSDFMEVNPATRLKEDFEYSFVEMADLEASNKLVRPKRKRKPKGLTKFQNGDTLFAKITPCLENGKICQVDGLEDGVGCGSTEFIVLRGKASVSDTNFVYYLSKYSAFRNYAIKNMGGTAGQQRVPTSIFNSLILSLPSLLEQKQIAAVLSSLDDKIELLRKQDEALEKIAQGIFKEWFVNFTIDGKKLKLKNGLPEGWRVGKLGEAIELFDSKRVPLASDVRVKRKGKYPYYGATSIMDYIDEYLFDGTYLLLAEDGSVIDEKGHPVLQYVQDQFWVSNHSHVLQGKNGFSTEILYVLLKRANVAGIVNGAVQLKINKTNLINFEIVIPPKNILEAFDSVLQPIFNKSTNNNSQIKTLSYLRDTLLPKLMSGEINCVK